MGEELDELQTLLQTDPLTEALIRAEREAYSNRVREKKSFNKQKVRNMDIALRDGNNAYFLEQYRSGEL